MSMDALVSNLFFGFEPGNATWAISGSSYPEIMSRPTYRAFYSPQHRTDYLLLFISTLRDYSRCFEEFYYCSRYCEEFYYCSRRCEQFFIILLVVTRLFSSIERDSLVITRAL